MANPNPSPETRFKPGQVANPTGKTAEQAARGEGVLIDADHITSTMRAHGVDVVAVTYISERDEFAVESSRGNVLVPVTHNTRLLNAIAYDMAAGTHNVLRDTQGEVMADDRVQPTPL